MQDSLQETNEELAEKLAEKKRIVTESLNYFTTELSRMTRVLNFALLGAIWTILTTNRGEPSLEQKLGGISVIGAFEVAILSIACALLIDFIQYIAAYFKDLRALKSLESGQHANDFIFSTSSFWYRTQRYAFRSKIFLTLANSLWVGAFLLVFIIS